VNGQLIREIAEEPAFGSFELFEVVLISFIAPSHTELTGTRIGAAPLH
jgi:hypothetical protein